MLADAPVVPSDPSADTDPESADTEVKLEPDLQKTAPAQAPTGALAAHNSPAGEAQPPNAVHRRRLAVSVVVLGLLLAGFLVLRWSSSPNTFEAYAEQRTAEDASWMTCAGWVGDDELAAMLRDQGSTDEEIRAGNVALILEGAQIQGSGATANDVYKYFNKRCQTSFAPASTTAAGEGEAGSFPQTAPTTKASASGAGSTASDAITTLRLGVYAECTSLTAYRSLISGPDAGESNSWMVPLEGQGNGWSSGTLEVASQDTLGMAFSDFDCYTGPTNLGAVPVAALQLIGQVPGEPVGLPARGQLASGCWAGTDEDEVDIRFQLDYSAGPADEYASDYMAIWSSQTLATLADGTDDPNLWEPMPLGHQDQPYCP